MSATQLSFPAFAAAQAASPCTPSASTPSVPADVVAHGTGSGGECIGSVLPPDTDALHQWAKAKPHGFFTADFRRAGFSYAAASTLFVEGSLTCVRVRPGVNWWFCP